MLLPLGEESSVRSSPVVFSTLHLDDSSTTVLSQVQREKLNFSGIKTGSLIHRNVFRTVKYKDRAIHL